MGDAVAALIAQLRSLFGLEAKKSAEPVDAEAIGLMFRQKYTNFRLLLTAGKRLLNTLADMERAKIDGRVFGMAFLRAGSTSATVNAYRMLQHLDALAPGRFERLYERFREIRAEVEGVLGRRAAPACGRLALDLAEVNAARADETGARLAELGEIKNRLGLPVPEGFVTGACAYEAFATHQGLREEIERRIQSVRFGGPALGLGHEVQDDEDALLSVEDVAAEVEALIEGWPLPPELEEALVGAARELSRRTGAATFTVIPASMGEGQAFVGRYQAQYGVPLAEIPQAFRRAVAGKYAPEAMLCRLWRGLPDMDVLMCAGVLAEPAACGQSFVSGLALSRSRVLAHTDAPAELVGAEAVRIMPFSEHPLACPVGEAQADPSCAPCLVCLDQGALAEAQVRYCGVEQPGAEAEHVLSGDQAVALGRLARALEEGLGAPVEFEWRRNPDGCFEVLRCGPQYAPADAREKAPQDPSAPHGHSRMEGTPVYARLTELLGKLSELTLPPPDSTDFRARNCKTVRDVARFAHEKAVQEMFDFGRGQQDFSERQAKQLWSGEAAMQWWIINLDDAYKSPPEGKFIRLENISCEPFQAVWEGISAFPWAGPPPVDARGFLSIIYESTTNPELSITGDFDFGAQNHILLSRAYVSLSSRFGYHFVTIEALVGERKTENFVSFQFRGGAAEFTRRQRRIQFVSELLTPFGFIMEQREDALLARVEGLPREEMMERLKILGYLLIHTRQLDMIMRIPEQVRLHKEKIFRELAVLLKTAPEA